MKYHHIGLAVIEIEKEASFYKKIGAKSVTPPVVDDLQKVKLQLLELGGQLIELVSPINKNTASPIDSYLKRRSRIYHTCYEVNSLLESIETMQKAGCTMILKPTPAILFNMRLVTFLFTPNGDLIELLERQ